MNAFTLVMLLIMIAGAVVCYLIASRSGMSTIWWPMFGFILPVVAILVLLLVLWIRSRRQGEPTPDDESETDDSPSLTPADA